MPIYAATLFLNGQESWSEEGLWVLQKVLDRLPRYWRVLDSSPKTLTLPHIQDFQELAAEHGIDELILGADGNYYPAYNCLTRPYDQIQRWAIGDARTGPDWSQRQRFHQDALEFIHRRIGSRRSEEHTSELSHPRLSRMPSSA